MSPLNSTKLYEPYLKPLLFLIGFLTSSADLIALLSDIPNGEYSNIAFSSTLGLYLKSSPVRYPYFLKSSEEYADILAASLNHIVPDLL